MYPGGIAKGIWSGKEVPACAAAKGAVPGTFVVEQFTAGFTNLSVLCAHDTLLKIQA